MCAPDKFGAVTFKNQWQGSLYSAGGGGALWGWGWTGALTRPDDSGVFSLP